MNDQERLTLLMTNYKGRENGKDSKFLAEKMEMENRAFRELFASLVEEGRAYLGSHSDHGYFMIADEEEYKLSVRQIESRIIKLAARKKALEKMHELDQTLSFEEGRQRIATAMAALKTT